MPVDAKPTPTTVPRRTMMVLERVWEAEINNRLPFQSKAKACLDLCEEGLLLPMERTFGTGGSAVTAHGFQLTHAGRFLYCSNCEDEDVKST